MSYTYTNRLRARLAVVLPHASPWEQTYAYDAGKRLTCTTSPAGGFSYAYVTNRQSLVQVLAVQNGAKITNAFDSVARLAGTFLRNSQGTAIDVQSYIYNPAGQRTNVTRTLGDNVTYIYDQIGQLQRVIGREAGGSPSRLNERFGYKYDAAGNLNCRTNYSLEQTFNVNSLNQVTTVTRPPGGQGNPLVVSGTTSGGATNVSMSGTGMTPSTPALYADGTWAFFGATLAEGTNTYTAVAVGTHGRTDTNTVSVYLPQTVSYRYDLNGNLLSDARRGFDYDDENQLIRVTITNSTRSDFAYDGRMRRRVRVECTWVSGAWVTNEIVRYVYDGNLVVQERHYVRQPAGEILQQVISYTRGKDLSGSLEGAGGIGGLLARSDLSTLNFQPSTSHAYYHADGNGNVTCLIDTNQVVVAKYLYESFGNIISQTGPLADANLYRFSTKEFHQPSGLVYYLYRYYEPNLQRWLNRDPIGERGGKNLYGFVANEPLDKYDPFGEDIGPKDHPPVPPQFGKKPFVTGRDNCLCYALDRPGKPLQPDGGKGGKNATNCQDPKEQIKKNYPGVTDVPRGRFFGEGKCPPGTHKIAVFSDEGTPGYHVQRQDSEGGWSDMSLSPDRAPAKCKRGDSGTDCGNLCAPDQP